MDIQVTVLDEDVPTLDALRKLAFREQAGEASYQLQKALRAERARANTPDRPRGTPRRTQTRTNGVARVEA